MRKDVPFAWSKKQEKAFCKIKEKLSYSPVLAIYNPKAEITDLHTVASADGLAAILLQSDEKKVLHPVYYISRRTADCERIYHSSKLELMAIAWTVERLRSFLIGLKFTIRTDCEALIFVNGMKTRNPQIARWLGAISEFDFEIKHRKGCNMQHVDALSRAPIEDKNSEEIGEVFSVTVIEDEILLYQYIDKDLEKKIEILKKPAKSRKKFEISLIKDYKLIDNILFKTVRVGNKVRDLYVIPKPMRKSIVIKNHDLCGHGGVDRTVSRILQYYYFPGMRQYIKRHVGSCIECILSKRKAGRQPGELHPITPGKRPFDIINIDHIGPFVSGVRKNQYVFIIIDNLTKFSMLYAVRSVDAKTSIRFLEKFIEQFGAPSRIISDRGSSFIAKEFGKFCDKHGIKHALNSTAHPQANGQVERLNQTILPSMMTNTSYEDKSDWDKELPLIQRQLNTSICKTTGVTPFEALYGYLPRFEDGLTRELTSNLETYKIPEIIQEEIRKNIEEEQVKYKKRYDRNRLKGVKYFIGDIVYIKAKTKSTGSSTKLQYRYRCFYACKKL